MNRVEHTIPPLFDARSRVLILGTMPSPKSREAGFYYMHPQNRFWPVLAALFGQPLPADAPARAAFALRHRIALWDVLRACEISGASDATIQLPVPNDITPILHTAKIAAIFTTGKKSTDLYNKFIYPATGIAATGLPSTSAANCACGLETLSEAYRLIFHILQEDRRMERIASFSIDHTKLMPGVYVSREDGDVVTYDVRMKRPNKGDYLSNGALHSIEHLLATFVRNSRFGEDIIYVGPMGCRTGNYFLVRNRMSRQDTLELLREAFAYLADYEGEVPGASELECGNWREHDVAAMREASREYARVLADWSVEKMVYEA